MSNALFSSNPFDFNGIQSLYSPLQDYAKDEEEITFKAKQDAMFPMEDLGRVYLLCSDHQYGATGSDQDNLAGKDFHFHKDQQQQQQRQPQKSSNCLTTGEYRGSCLPAPPQSMQEIRRLENIGKLSKEMPFPVALSSSSSLELLKNYGNGFKKLNQNQFGNLGTESLVGGRKRLSTEEVMRVAGARYIQFSDQRYDEYFSLLMHPFGYALSGLSEEEQKDVELAHLLLAAAEKVGYQQYDRASRLLSRCEWIASERSNPVQRVVYCFAEALRDRIDKATGRCAPKEKPGRTTTEIVHGLSISLATLKFHEKIAFNQVMHLTTIQTMIENVGSAKKLHIIDFEIRSGVQWIALMQALAEREQRPRHLKITAVSRLSYKDKIDETGKRLEAYAKSKNLPFTFKVVHVNCTLDLKEDMFQTAADESVVVTANMILRTLLSWTECLESLMKLIKNLNPSLMFVGEVEANHNSPGFVARFIEGLFYYSAYFDCLETCMGQDPQHRAGIELAFENGIGIMLTTEGTERITRSAKIDVWRAFFARFRMVEIGFSESSLYQAGLVLKHFPSGNLYTLERDGKCVLLGWKGTPLHSLSAWKFPRDRLGRPFLNYNFLNTQ